MTDEIVNKAYEAAEIAVKTGKIKKGTNEVTKAIERGNAKLVLVAGDVNPAEVVMHIEPLCKEKGVPCVIVPSREELGAASGISVTTSSIVIIEAGDSQPVIKEIIAAQTKEEEPKAEEVKEEPKAEEVKEEPKAEEVK
jgi:large subunit ribosomal protein L7Ae